jgi:hypothetical protein
MLTMPITLNPDDGAVTIRVTPEVWRWLADSARCAVSHRPSLGNSDCLTFYERLAGDLLDGCDDGPVDVASAAALVVSGLAVLGSSSIGSYVQDGLSFSASPCATDTLAQLGQLGVGPIYKVSEGKGLAEGVPASALASLLVEVVS